MSENDSPLIGGECIEVCPQGPTSHARGYRVWIRSTVDGDDWAQVVSSKEYGDAETTLKRAEYICRAVNAHEALVAALRDHARQLERMAERLAADVHPAHVDAITKNRAAEWAKALAVEAGAALVRAKGGAA